MSPRVHPILSLAALLTISAPTLAQTQPAASIPAATPANPNSMLFREGGAGLPAYPVVARDETTPARNARMKWFTDARFGLFIHWGVYAVPAGTWNGRPGGAEWIMNRAKIPIDQYKPLAQQFTAAKYDPQAWAALAKDAGVKYVVLTAKHHDGFTLYDSAVSDWNAVKASGAKRDLIAPLAAAVRAKGLQFGLYYSQSQDWTNPGGGKGNTTPWDDAQKQGDFDTYLAKIAVPQVKELMDKYHPAYLFFDTEYSMTPERARPFFDLACTDPDLIINNRLGGGVLGDTATPEQKIFTDPLGRAFEVCMTINNSWGCSAADTRWKSSQELIRNLSDIASKGGNYLLNIGPTADGTIPAPEIERLKAIGAWLNTNGEAIYATDAGPLYPPPAWGRTTQKTTPTGTTLYVHVWNWPADGKLTLAGITQQPRIARLLVTNGAVPFAPTLEGLTLTLPATAPDADVSVIALDFPQPLHLKKTVTRAAAPTESGTPADPSGGTPK